MHDLNARVRPKVLFFDQSEKEHLKGQRLRVWWARNAENVWASLVVLAAIGLMGLPAETALKYLVQALAFAGLAGFVWLCSDIRRERKDR